VSERIFKELRRYLTARGAIKPQQALVIQGLEEGEEPWTLLRYKERLFLAAVRGRGEEVRLRLLEVAAGEEKNGGRVVLLAEGLVLEGRRAGAQAELRLASPPIALVPDGALRSLVLELASRPPQPLAGLEALVLARMAGTEPDPEGWRELQRLLEMEDAPGGRYRLSWKVPSGRKGKE